MPDSLFSAVCQFAPVGLMVLDSNAQVVHINSFLKSMLSLSPNGYKGKLFGHALNCASVAGAGRLCGDTLACSSCCLRRGIAGALKHDRPVQYATLHHAFTIDGIQVLKTMRFSASSVSLKQGNKCALVWLADITRELQYERMLARELDMDAEPDIVSPQNLIGIVTELMQKSGRDSKACVGVVALEGIGVPKARGSMTRDEALRRFAEIARQCTRRQDIIAPAGDGSFILIYSGVGIQIAAAITRRIHDTMTAVFSAYGAGGVSFSAGFMELKATDLPALTSAGILRAAERQLEDALRRGGSLFVSRELTARLRD